MKTKKVRTKKQIVIIYSILLTILGFANLKYGFISIPSHEEMINRQIDFVTISTVFAGFSFTTLGLLFGLSSEKLIQMIQNTTIILKKADRIILSLVFFILSVVVSLSFILEINISMINNTALLIYIDSAKYVIGLGYLIGGIIYFAFSVYELSDLINRVYRFNQKEGNKIISAALVEMEIAKKKNENVVFDEE